MSDYNQMSMVGRVVRSPEVKILSSGLKVARVTIANNKSFKNKETNQYEERTNFFDFNLWGKKAETLVTYLTKGTKILIEGCLEKRSWDQAGETRYSNEIVIKNVYLLSSSSKDEKKTGSNTLEFEDITETFLCDQEDNDYFPTDEEIAIF